MSSTISAIETKTVHHKILAKLKMDEKPAKLIRTSSIEKIRRFNSYICSQHYIIVPAILTWLKSSHSGLQTQAEKTIFMFRSLIFNTFFYKLFVKAVRSVVKSKNTNLSKTKPLNDSVPNFYNTYSNSFEATFLFKLSVYLAISVVFAELVVSIYLLTLVPIPLGLYFLIFSIVYINGIYFTITSSEINPIRKSRSERVKSKSDIMIKNK